MRNERIKLVEKAIDEIKKGKIVIVSDDEERENEADLVCSAELATGEMINFLATYGKGLICLPLSSEIAKKLDFSLMVKNNTDNNQTAFTISIDHINTTTGISAFERALTCRKVCDVNSVSSDFKKPGHMFPLIAKDKGIFERKGHTEATVDLMKLAGLKPCGVCVEIMDDNGNMMKKEDLVNFSKKHDLISISIDDIENYINFKKG